MCVCNYVYSIRYGTKNNHLVDTNKSGTLGGCIMDMCDYNVYVI